MNLKQRLEERSVRGTPLGSTALISGIESELGFRRLFNFVHPGLGFAAAAIATLVLVGGVLIALRTNTAPVAPADTTTTTSAGVVELKWSTGVIAADLGGSVIEVADGWLFVPSEGGTQAWTSPDGATWVEQPTKPLFPEGSTLFQIVHTDLGYVATGHTGGLVGDGSRDLAIWHSPDAATWHQVDVFDPLPAPPHEFIELARAALLTGSPDRSVLAEYVVPQVDFDAVISSLGEDLGSVSHETSISEGTGRIVLRNVESDELVWQATFDELGFGPELISQLTGGLPFTVTTWASSDGGQSWRRGDNLELASPLAFAATDNDFVLAGRSTRDDAKPAMWLSTDGLRWRTAESEVGRWGVAASRDRFLAGGVDDQLSTSPAGEAWFPAGDELVSDVSPNGMGLYGGRVGFLFVGFHIDQAEDQETATFLFSADGDTWTDTGIRTILSPPDVGAEFVSATVGERSVAVIQRNKDGTLTVHIGTPSD